MLRVIRASLAALETNIQIQNDTHPPQGGHARKKTDANRSF